MTAASVIAALGLRPHPEGGWYAETWRAAPAPDGRSRGTAIHYLLVAGEQSARHRVDADEIWLFHAGSPLSLTVGPSSVVLGPSVALGERPQVVVPAGQWQSARPLGDWTLVSCVVVPGFEFSGFELAPCGPGCAHPAGPPDSRHCATSPPITAAT